MAMQAAGARAHLVTLVALVLASGCGSATGARDNAVLTFSSWHYCPEARVAAVEEHPQPLPDVASDPARLASWRDAHADPPLDHLTYVHAEGCGAEEHFVCSGAASCRRYRP